MTNDINKTSDEAEKRPNAPPKGERIAKLLARAGVGSRRAVERMIEAGMVKRDGIVIATPATLISSVDGITVDGMIVKPAEPTKIWKYHKPAGRMTTYYDPEGRPTIFQALPSNMPRVLSVGRLDLNTEGLLLLTNDGELSRWLELPATGWLRTYKVRCHGYFDREKVDEIRKGVTIEDVKYRGVKININENREQSNIWLTIGIKEGKNREVRKLLEYIGLQVTRLIRLSFGPFELGEMKRGDIQEVSLKDMQFHCADFFKDKGIMENSIQTEDVKPRKNKSKSGWAKAKPKVNARRANKKRTDPKRNEAKKNDTFETRKPARKK
ncbi:Ribosomal large subunit pseudouridine synthase B [hydrothermal vent metagenome]|uniref:Ribosomal large subunit pseudouridine synthase B n=1 Tax=hydrothermal vent metagenome TaxID=652676 RepID=A0A3B1ARR4_9ZZZZ